MSAQEFNAIMAERQTQSQIPEENIRLDFIHDE